LPVPSLNYSFHLVGLSFDLLHRRLRPARVGGRLVVLEPSSAELYFLSIEDLVELNGLSFEPADVSLQPSNFVVAHEFADDLVLLHFEVLELALYFEHLSAISSQEVAFMVLQSLNEVRVDRVDERVELVVVVRVGEQVFRRVRVSNESSHIFKYLDLVG
jgi:hypothetical protein